MRRSKGRRIISLWIRIAVLVLLTPFGLMLPGLFGAGGAWGEWGPEKLTSWMEKLGVPGFVSDRLRRMSELWDAPIKDYAIPGMEEGVRSYVSYMISAAIGVAIVALVTSLLMRALRRPGRRDDEDS